MKKVCVTMITRDSEGVETGNLSIDGTTEDDGANVEIPLGYLPGIENCQAGDIKLQIKSAPEDRMPSAAFVQAVDEELGVQRIAFTL